MFRILKFHRLQASIATIVGAVALLASPAAATSAYGLTRQCTSEHGEHGQGPGSAHGLWAGPTDWTFENWIFFEFEWNPVDLDVSESGEASVLPDHEFNWSSELLRADADPTGAVFHGVASAFPEPDDSLMFEGEWLAVTLAEPIGH